MLLCGGLEGGVDAYYYGERCILKKQHAELMRKNKKTSAFVSKALLDMPVLKELASADVPKADEVAALLDPDALNACVVFIAGHAGMKSHPDPKARVSAAVKAAAAKFPVVKQHVAAFKKLAAMGAVRSYETSIDNYNNFEGRPATNKK